jgi:putative transposase
MYSAGSALDGNRKDMGISNLIHHSDQGVQYASWEYVDRLKENGNETYDEAHKNIKKFLEVVYNKKRVHSSIGYVTPEDFEKSKEVLNRKVS